MSTLPAYSLSTGFVEDSLASLAGLLYSDSVDTRAAAGGAIALLYDAAGIAGLEGDSGMLQPPSLVFYGLGRNCRMVARLMRQLPLSLMARAANIQA